VRVRGAAVDQEGIKGGDQPSMPLNLCSLLRIGSPAVEADILLVVVSPNSALWRFSRTIDNAEER
jgi:hypothetical protein